MTLRRPAHRIAARIILLLLAGAIAIAAGCAPDAPESPYTAAVPAAADLPAAAPLPTITDLPTYAVSPTTIMAMPAAAESATRSPTATARATIAPTVMPKDNEFRPPAPVTGQLRLRDNLDDVAGYCIDLPGFGAGVRRDALLQAHSCKRQGDDQIFTIMEWVDGREVNWIVNGDLCLTVELSNGGGTLRLSPCAGEPGQRLELRPGGRLQVQGNIAFAGDGGAPAADAPPYCIGVAAGVGEPAGGRNHLRRDLTLYDCANADAALITWELVEQ